MSTPTQGEITARGLSRAEVREALRKAGCFEGSVSDHALGVLSGTGLAIVDAAELAGLRRRWVRIEDGCQMPKEGQEVERLSLGGVAETVIFSPAPGYADHPFILMRCRDGNLRLPADGLWREIQEVHDGDG